MAVKEIYSMYKIVLIYMPVKNIFFSFCHFYAQRSVESALISSCWMPYQMRIQNLLETVLHFSDLLPAWSRFLDSKSISLSRVPLRFNVKWRVSHQLDSKLCNGLSTQIRNSPSRLFAKKNDAAYYLHTLYRREDG